MKHPNKQLLFLEPGKLPNESDQETVQRLADVLRTKGFQIIENRKSHTKENKIRSKETGNE